ncbi:DNA polymerase III subunit chi [Gammaproteobacteria bacterium]
MIQVSFYVLPEVTPQGRLRLACKLIEKAYTADHPTYVYAPVESVAQAVDDLLWTFPRNKFLPHCLVADFSSPTSPIVIGDEHGFVAVAQNFFGNQVRAYLPETKDLGSVPGPILLNLASEVPHFFASFTKILELIEPNPEELQAGRNRFSYYRKQGILPETHKLSVVP